ncbi:NAD(P)/FAD-dependent oxidoreductase [Myxococcus sp. K15C18031901]|uniref:NAD(P)/FAD-dependent oxidoreductase n=1 Tax=Myxococcus dinghuensis TaxID=2906761 RepID=UPI0020A6E562|nr:NAD(P)/FAD-dependent oxidoreductase [Myxococcus dinghuensis]MCP3101507.1 NAD(P)/FAD-dependent oxidoreductase [Myxococcus dinghuensis]
MLHITPQLPPGQKHVIVIGGGFAGLNAAKALARHPQVQVTLIDQRNHHLFQPLLYQVATAGLRPSDIAVPIRAQFTGMRNVGVHLGRVRQVGLQEKWVEVEDDSGRAVRASYDYVVLACGAQHSYFGRSEWEPHAPGLKTLEQATEIRRRILSAFELAENEFDPERQRALLNFVVVGGGPTGVELAGAIADIARTVLVKDFRRINPSSARVLLVEAGARLLPAFAEDLSHRAARDLTELGVELRLSSRVTAVDAEGIQIGDERIQAGNVFWGAGVEADKLTRALGTELDRAGRVKVSQDLSIPGFPEAFVVGDAAHLEVGGQVIPGLAPAAIQTGEWAARNIIASIEQRPRTPFRYRDKGIMATIGKHRAIAQTGSLRLTGFIAWVAWLFVHVLYLIGFKNRVTVFLEWTWSYLFAKRGARLITQRDWKLRA